VNFLKEKLIELVEKNYLKADVPQFKAGDTVAVHYKVKEGNKERIQVFEGVVIRVSGGSVAKNFTVRKVSSGIGVERIIPLNSPLVEKIDSDETFKPNVIVIYGKNFESAMQNEICHNLNVLTNAKSIELKIIIRYI